MYHRLLLQLVAALLAADQLLIIAENGVLAQSSTDEEISSSIFNDTILSPSSFPMDDAPRCQQMQIQFCDKVAYNRTLLPNILGHQTQSDVESEINIYHPLVKGGCSPDLKLFLCTVYAPICFDHDNGSDITLLPCRSLCESARQGCAAQARNIGYEWPQALKCDRFPDGRVKGTLCVGNDSQIDNYERENYNNVPRDLGFICPKNFEVNSYTLYLNGKTYNNCAMPCEDVYLDRRGTRIVSLVAFILAIVCIVSTSFTCITFLINTERFKYPARPIVIIAFCQLIEATCYLIGFLTSNKIACNDPVEPPRALPNMRMIRTTSMGNKKGSCTLLFMALYFFQMSTMFWWLMMTISWYMIAKLKWAPEAVSSVARYFHLFSWTVPALLTVYLSVLGNIEGDSLTGTCNVNVSNLESVTAFIIIPTTVCLIAGCFFLSIGFKSIWDSREVLRREYGKQTNEHYKLVIRIGLYSLLFVMFSILFVYTQHHDQINQTSWKLSWLSNICKNRDYSIPCPVGDFSGRRPHYVVFVLKYVATMAIGIISALFMLSKKTISAYNELAEFCIFKVRM